MKTHFLRTLAGVALLFASAAHLPAATILVPDNHATIQEAIDAATDGDTIEITNSATYAFPFLSWNKRLKLMASPGQNPTLTNQGAMFQASTGRALISADSGANDSQIGSLDGGRINIIFNALDADFDNSQRVFLFPRLTGSGQITRATLENLYIKQETGGDPARGARFNLIRAENDVDRHFILTNVEIDEGGTVHDSEIFRINDNLATMTLTNVYVHNLGAGTSAYVTYARLGTIYNITNCVFDGSNSGAPIVRSFGSLTSYPNRNTYNITNSIVIGGSGGAIQRTSSAAEFNLEDSVFVAQNGSVYSGTSEDDYDTIVADHCDFILLDADGTSELAIINASSTTAKNITITNSNMVAYGTNLSTSTLAAVEINNATAGTKTLSHNNAHAPGWSTLYSAGLTPANSLSLDPEYVDVLGLDVSYANTTLKTADSAGGPIGNDRSMVDLLDFIPEPVNPARYWTLY